MSRSCGVLVLAFLAFTTVLLAFAIRPTPFTGFGADELGSSVSGDGPLDGGSGSCEERNGHWSCTVIEPGDRSDSDFFFARYAVEEPNWWGCWTARRVDRPDEGDGFEETLDGCITLLNHL